MDNDLRIKKGRTKRWCFSLREAIAMGATVFVAKEAYQWLNVICNSELKRFGRFLDKKVEELKAKQEG